MKPAVIYIYSCLRNIVAMILIVFKSSISQLKRMSDWDTCQFYHSEIGCKRTFQISRQAGDSKKAKLELSANIDGHSFLASFFSDS